MYLISTKQDDMQKHATLFENTATDVLNLDILTDGLIQCKVTDRAQRGRTRNIQ
jgi:hypothetical protein